MRPAPTRLDRPQCAPGRRYRGSCRTSAGSPPTRRGADDGSQPPAGARHFINRPESHAARTWIRLEARPARSLARPTEAAYSCHRSRAHLEDFAADVRLERPARASTPSSHGHLRTARAPSRCSYSCTSWIVLTPWMKSGVLAAGQEGQTVAAAEVDEAQQQGEHDALDEQDEEEPHGGGRPPGHRQVGRRRTKTTPATLDRVSRISPKANTSSRTPTISL